MQLVHEIGFLWSLLQGSSLSVADDDLLQAYKGERLAVRANVKSERTITYVEFGADGHQPVWIKTIMDAFERSGEAFRMQVWVSHDVFNREDLRLPLDSRVRIRSHEELFSSSREGGKAPGRFEVIRRCIDIDKPEVCFVGLNLDACAKDIAFSFPGSLRTKLVGISSQPFLHYIRFSSNRTKMWLSLRRYLPVFVKTLLMCHRRQVAKIFVLDPLAAGFYNKVLGTSKFEYLPEHFDQTDPLADGRQHFGLPEDRTIFLFIGNISRRKGIIEFLGALRAALAESREFRDDIAVVIAGLIMEDVRQEVYESTTQLHSQFPDVPVVIFDRFVSDKEFVTLISISDIVCMPYVFFAGSSSILIHAASFGRLVLASDFGIIGELMRRYGLGIICNESDPQDLKKALYRCVADSKRMSDARRQTMKDFAGRHSMPLGQFGEKICSSLLKVAAGGNRGI